MVPSDSGAENNNTGGRRPIRRSSYTRSEYISWGSAAADIRSECPGEDIRNKRIHKRCSRRQSTENPERSFSERDMHPAASPQASHAGSSSPYWNRTPILPVQTGRSEQKTRPSVITDNIYAFSTLMTFLSSSIPLLSFHNIS